MEVVERIEERQDVREERRREPLEEDRRVGAGQPAVERDEVDVLVDGVHGPDERPEPVEDHDDAGDDVVIEENLKILGRVRIAAAEPGGRGGNERDQPHSQKNSRALQRAEAREARDDQRRREQRRQGVDRLPVHGRVLAHEPIITTVRCAAVLLLSGALAASAAPAPPAGAERSSSRT